MCWLLVVLRRSRAKRVNFFWKLDDKQVGGVRKRTQVRWKVGSQFPRFVRQGSLEDFQFPGFVRKWISNFHGSFESGFSTTPSPPTCKIFFRASREAPIFKDRWKGDFQVPKVRSLVDF